MYCSKCGAELRDGASFCARCGSPVKKRDNASKAPVRDKAASKAKSGPAAAGKTEAIEKAAVSALKKVVIRSVKASAEPGEMKISLPAVNLKEMRR